MGSSACDEEKAQVYMLANDVCLCNLQLLCLAQANLASWLPIIMLIHQPKDVVMPCVHL